MKKQLGIVLLIGFLVSTTAFSASAQDEVVSDENNEAVEVDSMGLLPTNPFYFLKEWSRGVRGAFVLDPVEKAEYELDIAEEKSREFEVVSELEDGDQSAVERASRNYEQAMERLRLRLEGVEEKTDNPRFQELLGKVTDRVERHERRLEKLSERFENIREFRNKVRNIIENLDHIGEFPLIDPEQSREILDRVENIVEEGEGEIRNRFRDIEFDRLPDEVNSLKDRFDIRLDGVDRFRERLKIKDGHIEQEVRLRSDSDDVEED